MKQLNFGHFNTNSKRFTVNEVSTVNGQIIRFRRQVKRWSEKSSGWFLVFRGVKGLIVSCETCSISGMNNLAIFGFFEGNIILYLPPSSKIYSSILRRGSIFGLDPPPR